MFDRFSLEPAINREQVVAALDTSSLMVFRIKAGTPRKGWTVYCTITPQANRNRKLDDRGEAHLIVLACSDAPEGHDHWTLRLLADKVLELGLVESLSYETVRFRLKNTLKPWRKQQWCISQMNGEFVAAIEDVLDLYAEPYDPKRPVVCFDETSTQLLADVREPLPAQPGRPRRVDYEYRRGGTRNLFLSCEPLAGWRHVAITEHRTMRHFARQMQWLVDTAYPLATIVRVMPDNLNIHRMASLYETFQPAEARRIAKRLEFHPTPKHASWLNMAEIEFSALNRSCLNGRNPDATHCNAPSRPTKLAATQPASASTGASVPATPGSNSIGSTPVFPTLTDYYNSTGKDRLSSSALRFSPRI